MIVWSEDSMPVKVSPDVSTEYVLEGLAEDAGERNWPIIRWLVSVAFFIDRGNPSLFPRLW